MRSGVHKEVEIKLRVENPAALRKKLKALRARRICRVHERNVLFDTPESDLRRAGKLLRLRWNDGRAVLTVKTPVKGKRASARRFKVRREIEFPVDAQKIQVVLAAAGFVEGFRYEKRRTSYCVPRAGNVQLELDETPIGTFVELEGAPAAIDRLAERLGYTRSQYITANYRVLFQEWCRRRGRRQAHMLFSRRENRRKSKR